MCYNVMKQSNWKEEKLKYTRCTSMNIPVVSSRLFYKIAHTVRDRHLAPCILKEIKGDNALVEIPEDSGLTMEAPIKDFFFLNGSNCKR